jgi:hypothetical protein
MAVIRFFAISATLALGLAGNASAQSGEVFSQAQATALTPGFAQACASEIASAMSRAGNNGLPQAEGMARLDTYVGSSKTNAQQNFTMLKKP